MIINRTVKANLSDTIYKKGRFLSFITVNTGTRIRIMKGGFVVLETVVIQGMAVKDVDFDAITIESEGEQTVVFWASMVELEYTVPEQNASRMSVDSSYSGAGVVTMIGNDPTRVRLIAKSDRKIYIGNDSLVEVDNVPENGYSHEANKEFELIGSGEIKCWTAHEIKETVIAAEQEFFLVCIDAGVTKDAITLEGLGVDYFDIVVPPELSGINVMYDFTYWVGSGNYSYNVSLYASIGEQGTNDLKMITQGGGVAAGSTWEQSRAVSMNLTAGTHRLYFFDVGSSAAVGSRGRISMREYSSTDQLIAKGALISIMSEHF